MYGVTGLLLLTAISKTILAHRIGVFLLYFSQSTISILHLLQLDQGLPEVIQSSLLILDPSVVLGTSLMLATLYLLPKIALKTSYAVITGSIIGVIAQIKVYAGIIALISFFLFVFYKLLTKAKLKNYLISLFCAGSITFLTFGLNNFGSGSLVLAPLLFYEQYMEQSFFNSTHWGIKKILFKENHNMPRLLILYMQGIFIFWVFNLGAKLILLLKIPVLFKKSFWQNDYNVVFIFAVGTGILVPSFFIQSRSVFDVVQFLWITIAILAIPAGIIWTDIFNKSFLLKILSVGIILLFSSIGTAYSIYPYIASSNPLIINTNDLNLYKRFAEYIPSNDSVIYLPNISIKNKHVDYAWHNKPFFAALLGRQIYYEGDITPYVKQEILTQRERNILSLYKAINHCNEFEIHKVLKQIGTHFILTSQRDTCLGSTKIRGIKIQSKTSNLYIIQTK